VNGVAGDGGEYGAGGDRAGREVGQEMSAGGVCAPELDAVDAVVGGEIEAAVERLGGGGGAEEGDVLRSAGIVHDQHRIGAGDGAVGVPEARYALGVGGPEIEGAVDGGHVVDL